ncbi:MAG TPA: amidohydrolase family protein [Beijerinckiaceae bacterium]|jgi:predicted TIM-barrel fold metal-dependent hydrolase|nr:amidohydrolase family protein [Beijerinckiaceae bacterium]
MRDGYRVLDVDSHVTPSMEVLHRYAAQPLKDRWEELTPYARKMNSPPGRGHPTTPWHSLRIKPIPYNRIAGQKPDVEKVEKGGAGATEGRVENVSSEICHERIQHDNPHGRLDDMTKEGVDVNVLIPGTWAPGSSALEPFLTTNLYDAYHNYMRDFCSADTKRLKGLFLAPGANIEWAVKEIKRIGKEDWLCAVWPSLPEGLPIDDPDLDPLWEVMNDLHLPIMHHSFFYEPPYFPGYRDIWGNAAIARTAAHPWGAQRSLAYIIAGGILDRYPNIKVGYSETGHGWLPYWLKRLDSQVTYVKGVVPKLKYLPTEYAQQGRIKVCIEAHEGPEMTKAVNDVLGDNCLMYASDFPHPECDWPHSVDNVIKWKGVLGESALRKLLGTNADDYIRH